MRGAIPPSSSSHGPPGSCVRVTAWQVLARPSAPQRASPSQGWFGFPGRFENMGAVAGQFASLPLYQRPTDWYSRWASRVGAQTTEGVNRIAQRSGDLDDYVIVVGGNRRKVEPALEGLPWELHLFDAQGRPVPE